ncbi:MAG: hypothetical protein IPJ87_15635 [Flavobacteriales bacterium]|jgi:hypothetical protein|nr:hypothetical protein [Flavobacteriales bacterium]MBK7943281.1 hypothetical protein [Flavobacteriales bacterium]MBK9700030.1 hypothetical protein [Flavobacteriales bacterium]
MWRPLKAWCTLSLLPVISVFLAGAAKAQVVLYPSMEAYRTRAGEAVGAFVELVPAGRDHRITVEKDGARREVGCSTLWGFGYGDVVYRINPDERHAPVRLWTHGGICYYENGHAHLRMQHERLEQVMFAEGQGHRSYVSKDLEGPIVPAVFREGDERSASGRFRAAHPQYAPLYTCIGGADDLDRTRQCVVDFEVMLEGE